MKKVKREDGETLPKTGETMECSKAEDECSEQDAHDEGTPLPPEALGRIGKQLREVYGLLVDEPLPEKFITLLDNLAKAEPKT